MYRNVIEFVSRIFPFSLVKVEHVEITFGDNGEAIVRVWYSKGIYPPPPPVTLNNFITYAEMNRLRVLIKELYGL